MAAVNGLLPDYAGFIIGYPKSIRSLSPDAARELAGRLDHRVQAVGVFVNAPIELPLRMLREGVVQLVQLHGSEGDEYIRSLQERTHRPVVKAFSIRGLSDIEMARACPADYVLLDHALGENGRVLEWDMLKGLDRPFFLAGGLGEANVGEAITALHPFAVDMNSALETDGRKDPRKMALAVAAARAVGRRVDPSLGGIV